MNFEYQKHCFLMPVVPSVVMGGAFTVIDMMTHGTRLSPYMAATNMGGLYVYHTLQCPMEAIHGRQSAVHNVISGATIGYLGVQSGRLGIPFLDTMFFYRHPTLSPAMAGAMVYGAMGGVFATLGGKPM